MSSCSDTVQRKVQLLVPSYEFSVPEKECTPCETEDPCCLFGKLRFPVDQFFPPETLGEDPRGENGCHCRWCLITRPRGGWSFLGGKKGWRRWQTPPSYIYYINRKENPISKCRQWKLTTDKRKPRAFRPGASVWSGWGESNPRIQLGKLMFCHWTTPANKYFTVLPNYSTRAWDLAREKQGKSFDFFCKNHLTMRERCGILAKLSGDGRRPQKKV